MIDYVLNTKSKPVMSCSPVIARLLLKQGNMKVTRRTPFTIQLTCELEEEYMQELDTGLDTGSGRFSAAVTNEKKAVLYLSQTQVRNDIKKKMTRRRQYRRMRRHRECRYHPARFNNRQVSTWIGRLAPTLTSKLETHVRELEFIARVLPISMDRLIIESAQFDIDAIKDPKVLTNKGSTKKVRCMATKILRCMCRQGTTIPFRSPLVATESLHLELVPFGRIILQKRLPIHPPHK